MALSGLFFYPSGIKVEGVLDTLSKLKQLPSDVLLLGKGALPISPGLYPWSWRRTDEPNFKALQGGLLVAPILQKLILNREPERVLAWADKVASWGFKRIIPAHLANDLKADGRAFRKAFNFLEKKGPRPPVGDPGDVKLLSDVSKSLTESKVLFPEAPLV